MFKSCLKYTLSMKFTNQINKKSYSRLSLVTKVGREEIYNQIKKKSILLRGQLVKKRYAVFDFPIAGRHIHSYSWSDLSGHASFLFLAVSYLESDFMSLRM